MTNAKVLKLLSRYRACNELEEWAEAHGGPMEDLWRDCQRGDWLLWLAAKAGVDRHIVVEAACACARTALQYVPSGEENPRRALETAEAWARGKADRTALRAATAKITFSADATTTFATYSSTVIFAICSASASAAAAAYAAAIAAITGAATAAAYAANAAAYVASAAFYASDGDKSAWAQTLVECATIVRAHIGAANVETIALKGRTSCKIQKC